MPTHSDPRRSSQKVSSLCASLEPDTIDVLVAPEMCLSGYVFQGLNEIKPFCEQARDPDGPTVELSTSLSKRIGCYTLMGFPEFSPDASALTNASTPFDARPESEQQQQHTSPSTQHYYNSALLTSPNGEIAHVFRKHFLFSDDERWSGPGAGFQFIDVDVRGGSAQVRIAVGICMDLNPYAFKTNFEKCEFTTWCRDNRVGLVLVPMAWLSGGGQEGTETDWDVVDYWAARCAPLWEDVDCVFVACNRTGTEGGELCVCGRISGVVGLCSSRRPFPHRIDIRGLVDDDFVWKGQETSCGSGHGEAGGGAVGPDC